MSRIGRAPNNGVLRVVPSLWMILSHAWAFFHLVAVGVEAEARHRHRHRHGQFHATLAFHSTRTAGFLNRRSVLLSAAFVSHLNEKGHCHAHKQHEQQRYAALSNPNDDHNPKNHNRCSSSSYRRDTVSSPSDNRRRVLQNLFLVSSISTLTIPATAHAFSFGNNNNNNEPKEVKPTIALDKMGNPIKANTYLSSKQSQTNTRTRNGDFIMIQGLKGDPTYLLLQQDKIGGIESFALNAECTHLGCIVPYDSIQKKFICPCHGSQYDSLGNVLRGPAPGPLKLAKVLVPQPEGEREEEENVVGDGNVLLLPWVEDDFRTGEKPWWI